MIASLSLVIAALAWFAVYQGTMAYILRPPEIAGLSRVAGRIERVDTPVPRNRNDPYSELVFETASTRPQRVSVRHLSLDRAAIEALEGQTAAVRFAGNRPRNKWAYEIIADGRTILALDAERERDDSARRTALLRAIISTALAAVLLALIVRRRHDALT